MRLLRLYFLYIGLKDLDVLALMDVTVIKGDNSDDIISTALPVVFNLALDWWLLGGSFLIRRAYPEPCQEFQIVFLHWRSRRHQHPNLSKPKP